MKVAIVGIGWYGFRPNTKDVSFREMMFEAAVRAYEDAGNINPRTDVDTFISCQEDFWEGIAISDEFAPDPIGGAMRPTMTVTGDGLQGILHGVMHIKSGLANITVVESHAKPSDILTMRDIIEFAFDPMYRVGAKNIHFLAGLEALKFMKLRNATREDFAKVVVKNKRNGLKNPRASYASNINLEDVLEREYTVYPLTDLDISRFVDAAVVVVLASEEIARKYTDTPIWIDGIYSATDSTIELSELGEARYMKIASKEAYNMAKVNIREIKAAFVDDTYSYKELQHVEGLSLSDNAVKDLREGEFEKGGKIEVNPLGGHLAKGRPLEVSGLSLLLDAVEYLRQGVVDKAVVASWRGIPTFTGVVGVVSR
ncbi:thiolase domain-containing protein [Sulfurisphaera ohwakuensis]|uniref:Acetyl-CoA C-acetyltransferase n=1 Tax=Sulfurisphaera ohwakuensis TaxID=69656 RepID=A0A650CIB5_SULOH|nr:thiolase domain-containing protein [Sulfurisphaera ohwakuensis]MBB5253810.1 acetyl-CoA C-acetyltransferase [Sulfurisphaera ohwakuensis]QGR17516.1 thiolase domain-containing protein [Sulfurisphaera ohwakuensis]